MSIEQVLQTSAEGIIVWLLEFPPKLSLLNCKSTHTLKEGDSQVTSPLAALFISSFKVEAGGKPSLSSYTLAVSCVQLLFVPTGEVGAGVLRRNNKWQLEQTRPVLMILRAQS